MTSSFLSRSLDPRAICPRVTAGSPAEVIGVIADRLGAIGAVKASWRQAVIDREAVMPTGLPLADGLAVAVPHTDPAHVVTPALAIATLTRPVGFRSMEDPDLELPVGLVFALALRDKNEQIEMLQTIAETLQDTPLLRRLAAARTVEEIVAAFDGADPDNKRNETGGPS